jgi:hypothetical protein
MRYPPTVHWDEEEMDQYEIRPMVSPEDWCGEHRVQREDKYDFTDNKR